MSFIFLSECPERWHVCCTESSNDTRRQPGFGASTSSAPALGSAIGACRGERTVGGPGWSACTTSARSLQSGTGQIALRQPGRGHHSPRLTPIPGQLDDAFDIFPVLHQFCLLYASFDMNLTTPDTSTLLARGAAVCRVVAAPVAMSDSRPGCFPSFEVGSPQHFAASICTG